jgi:hypothetical protein
VKDRKLTEKLSKSLQLWQTRYLRLVKRVSTPANWDKTLSAVAERAARINHESRITGNALINIVDEILRHRRRGLSDNEIQAAIEQLIVAQTLNPDFVAQQPESFTPSARKAIVYTFFSVVDGYREDI